MKSPCIKDLLRLLTVVLCSVMVVVLVSGCGGADPAAIGKEWKAAKAELDAAGADADKKKAAQTKLDAATAKYDKLTADQKKEADKTKS